MYYIAQNFGNRKLWQATTDLPKFYPLTISILADFQPICQCVSAKLFWTVARQSFLPLQFCAMQYNILCHMI